MDQKMQGVCPICEKSATLKCSSCNQQFYCSKEHQRQDWPRHKSVCHAWEIHENSELGRHLLASRDLNPGDVILSESPLVWGPILHTTKKLCVGCGNECLEDYQKCFKCNWWACQNDCPGLFDKYRHGLECPFLTKVRIRPRCEVLLVIRMLILWRKKSKSWAALDKLLSYVDSRGPGTNAYEEAVDIKRYIGCLLPADCSDTTIVDKIIGLIDVNALETTPPEGCAALYEVACLLEHSCLANTKHSFVLDDKGRPRIIVKAVRSIKKGEHLSTMYTHALWTTYVRRRHLLQTKYFSCRCKRCADPTELGTYFGALKCLQDNGYILPMDPLNSESKWCCNTCPAILTAAEATEFMDKLENDVYEIMVEAQRNTMSDLLTRLTTLLHPGHQHCITVSHSLIQLMVPNDPKKPELCRRIIETTKALDPYNSRLSLYLASTLRELSACPGENGKELLSEAISLLVHEPRHSPGEKLKLLMEYELKSL